MLEKKFNIQNLALLSIILAPFFFIVGSLFANLSILIIFIVYLIIEPKNKFLILLKDNKFIIISTILIFLINILNSQYLFFSAQKTISFLRYFLFAISLSFILRFLSSNKIKIYSKILIYLILFLIFDCFLQFYSGTDLFGFPYISSYNRITGPFGDEMIIGTYIFNFGFLTLSLINYFYKIKSEHNFLLFLLISITVLFTGERSAFLSVLYFFILILIVYSKKRLILITTLVLIISSFFIIKNSEILNNKYNLKKHIDNISLSSNKSNFDNELQDKNINNLKYSNKLQNFFEKNKWLGHYQKSIEIFKDNVLFGSGFRTYRNVCLKNYENSDLNDLKCSIHPHNFHFEILADNGIIGYLLFLFLLGLILIKFFKNKQYNNFGLSILFCLIITFVIPLKPTGSFFTTNTAFIFWYLLGHFYGLSGIYKTQSLKENFFNNKK